MGWTMRILSFIIVSWLASMSMGAPITFIDATENSGLPLMNSARLCFTDLDGDGRADQIGRAHV